MYSTHRNALYKGILVANAYYDKIEIFMKIYSQMETQSGAKINVWAIRGPIFEVLGHVFRNAFFLMMFEVCKNRPKIDPQGHFEEARRSERGCREGGRVKNLPGYAKICREL